jgi:hypothetical protein
MRFTVKHPEVLHHRNKFSKPCNTEWENDDNMVKENIMRSVGCRPPHWKINTPLSTCSKTEEMAKFRWPTYHDLKRFPLPCNVIETIQFDYEEVDSYISAGKGYVGKKNVTSWFGISIYFPELSYKEIQQEQAYDIESFVGDAGGYIGLFLGYSFLCIPGLLRKMFCKARELGQIALPRIQIQRNELDKTSSITVKISELDKKCNIEIKDTEITSVIDLMRQIDQRQLELECKVKEVEYKIDLVLSVNGMTSNIRLCSGMIPLREKEVDSTFQTNLTL